MIILTNCEKGLSRRPWKSPNHFYTEIFLKSLHDAVLYAEIWGLIYKMLRRNHPKFDLMIIFRISICVFHRVNVRTENASTHLFQMWNIRIANYVELAHNWMVSACKRPLINVINIKHITNHHNLEKWAARTAYIRKKQRQFYKYVRWREFKRAHTLRSNLNVCTLYKWGPWSGVHTTHALQATYWNTNPSIL